MKDLISRKLVEELIEVVKDKTNHGEPFPYESAMAFIKALPSEKSFDENRVEHLLDTIYACVGTSLSAEGVATRKYCFDKLGKELYGEENVPEWMVWKI